MKLSNDYQHRTLEEFDKMIQRQYQDLNSIDHSAQSQTHPLFPTYHSQPKIITPLLKLAHHYPNDKQNIQSINWKNANKLFKKKSKPKSKQNSLKSFKNEKEKDSRKKMHKKSSKESIYKKIQEQQRRSIKNINKIKPSICNLKTDESINLKTQISQQPVLIQDLYQYSVINFQNKKQQPIKLDIEKILIQNKDKKKQLECTFKPTLNQKSLEIAGKLGSPFERLTNRQKINQENSLETKRHSCIKIRNQQAQIKSNSNNQNFKFKPKICQKSRQIAFNYQPIQQRCQIWNQNKKKQKEQKKQQRNQILFSQCTFQPSITKYSNKKSNNEVKGSHQWLNSRAKQKIYDKIKTKKIERISQGCYKDLCERESKVRRQDYFDVKLQQAILKLHMKIKNLNLS